MMSISRQSFQLLGTIHLFNSFLFIYLFHFCSFTYLSIYLFIYLFNSINLGTAALFIASKYEEIYPPDINEFVYITDDSYSKEQILNMEKLILKVNTKQTSCNLT